LYNHTSQLSWSISKHTHYNSVEIKPTCWCGKPHHVHYTAFFEFFSRFYDSFSIFTIKPTFFHFFLLHVIFYQSVPTSWATIFHNSFTRSIYLLRDLPLDLLPSNDQIIISFIRRSSASHTCLTHCVGILLINFTTSSFLYKCTGCVFVH